MKSAPVDTVLHEFALLAGDMFREIAVEPQLLETRYKSEVNGKEGKL